MGSSIGTPLVGSGSNSEYQLDSGFWAQVRALRAQQARAFRTIDGSGNNRGNADWGKVDTALIRSATAAYADGLSEPRGGFDSTHPSPRLISNLVVAQTDPLFNTLGMSDMFWQWGQFLDHDLDLTEAAEPHESFPITVPADDPLFNPPGFISLNRSVYITDTHGVRQQLNQITHWMDASQLYGSTVGRALWKRVVLPDGSFSAYLATSDDNLLPYEPSGTCGGSLPCFGAGDIRANEQPGLTALHTLFMREHNRLVDLLRVEYPDWTEDDLYETARLLLGSELQRITYDEWLPLLLGANALTPYTGYDSSVDPSIANEFSTACFRFGHTMLSGTLLRLDANGLSIGDIPLRDGFFNTSFILDDGIDPILRGLMAQQAQELDTQLVDDVRNFLFGPPGAGGFDLAALNIQRGRDHGLASYNDTRAALGLARAASFADITSDPVLQTKLAQAYSTVDEVDLWIGGLAEDAVNGGLLGETCSMVLIDQFERLRDGDRFWHGNLNWTAYELAADPIIHADGTTLGSMTLTDIITWNSGVVNVQDNPFIAPRTVDSVTGFYVIAADNSADNPATLAPFVRPTILEIRAATEADNKTAVILVDYPGDDNTAILVYQDGNLVYDSALDGLPNASGVQQLTIREYDVTDGPTLGGFLIWGRTRYADPNTRTYFSYIGHGTAAAPAVDYPEPTTRRTGSLIPLPYIVGVNPAYTDETPNPSLITPHALEVALDAATQNGAAPFDIVDLSHCFAATVEEMTELANADGDAHAEVFIGSPNYTYLAPALPGAALTAIDPQDTVTASASQLINTYDTTLATYEDGSVMHPGIWVAVAGSAVEAVESAVDALSVALLDRFAADADGTHAALRDAYLTAGAYYDTPIATDADGQCSPDWTLTNEDSLVDLKAFMQRIRSTFAAHVEVVAAAQAVETAVDNAILHKATRDGIPAFAPDAPSWVFSESNRSGLAMLGGLNGAQNGGMTVLPYQTTYYTDTTSVHAPNDNPHPLAFVQSDSASWADVLTRYWATSDVTLATMACLPELQIVQQQGELAVTAIPLPLDDTVQQFEPARLGARISADVEMFFVTVLFEVIHNGDVIFSDLVTDSHIPRGFDFVSSSRLWIPTLNPGELFTVRVTVDPHNRVTEDNETDNVLIRTDQIASQEHFIITGTIQGGRQWFTTPTVPLILDHDLTDGTTLDILHGQLYRFEPDPTNPEARVGRILSEFDIIDLSDLSNVVAQLPDDTPPGALLLRLWGQRGVDLSANFVEVRLNYAPPNLTINTGESVEFVYDATAGDHLRFAFTEHSGSVVFYTQTPSLFFSAEMITGTGTLVLASSAAGSYILRVDGLADGSIYSVDVSRNGTPGRAGISAESTMVEMLRPIFIDPDISKPDVMRPPSAVTLRSVQTIVPIAPVALVMGLLIATVFVIDYVRRSR